MLKHASTLNIRIDLLCLLWAVASIVDEQLPRFQLLNLGMAATLVFRFSLFFWGGVGIEMVVVQHSDEYAHTDGEEVVRFPNFSRGWGP